MILTRDEARQVIRESWRDVMPRITSKAKNKVNGENSWICPLCGHGKGGDGLTFDKSSKGGNSLKCFGCGFSGDIIDLCQQVNSVDFNTALSLLADEIGITIDNHRPAASDNLRPQQDAQKRHKTADNKTGDNLTAVTTEAPEKATETATEATADYTAYYRECTARINDPDAISYLQKRGISAATAAAYWLGYDPAADPANTPGATGDQYKPHPAPRLIIPTTKAHYIARSIDPNTDKMYQKMNPNREKGAGAAGIFNWRALDNQEVREIFITEGALNALSIIEAGATAIATNSASNRDILLKALKEKPTDATFILAFDNDPAGRTATEKMKEGLKQLNICYVVAGTDVTGKGDSEKDKDGKPGKEDANDLLIKDRLAFVEAVKNAISEAEKAAQAPQEAVEQQEELQPDYLTSFFEKIQTEAYKPYSTGLGFFDNMLNGGVMRQTLLLLMAAPGAGKTTLCQQIAEEMAIRKKPVIYLNMEMSREQMLAKALSYKLAIKKGSVKKSATEILQGYSWRDNESEKQIMTDLLEEYREKSFPYIQYNPGNVGSDLDDIIKYLREVGNKARFEGEQAPAVVVDYLHLISTTKGLDVQELIKRTVTELKRYAIDYDTFVIGIVATNRSSNGSISLDSGRDSSNLEYSGDYVLSLDYWKADQSKTRLSAEELAEEQKKKYRHMIIRVLKGRLGEVGNYARVYYNAANNVFYGEHEWLPVDDERTPFDADPAGTKAKQAKKNRI